MYESLSHELTDDRTHLHARVPVPFKALLGKQAPSWQCPC